METDETATNPGEGEDAPELEVDTEGHEDETEQQFDDEGNPIEEPPEDDSEEIEHDGQKYKVPKAIKPLLMFNADYTRKTQEVAELRKAVEAERSSFQQATAEEVQARAQVIALDEQIARFQQVDWDAWENEDPFEAQKGWRQYQQLQQTRGAAAGRFVQLQQQRTLAQQQETVRLIEQGRQVLAREIKGWSPQLAETLLETGVKEYGFDRGEIEDFTDPRMVKVLHDAHQWRQAQKKTQQAKRHEAAQTTTPAAKPRGGSAPPTGLDDRLSPEEWARRRNAQLRKR